MPDDKYSQQDNDRDPNRQEKGGDNDGDRGPGGRRPNGGKGPNGQNFMSKGLIGWILFAGLAVALLFLMQHARQPAKYLDSQQFMNYAKAGDFNGPVTMETNRIVGTLKKGITGGSANVKSGEKVAITMMPNAVEYWQGRLDKVNQPYKQDPGNDLWMNLLISWGPIIIAVLLVYFFVFRSLRNAGGGPGMLGNFGRSKHKMLTKEHSNITLMDVAGIDEAKDEVGEIIEFLKTPKKFQRLGGRVPRGVLLIGSPGCGKTLLAKAVAGEADVPFFSISGSDFVEMFVGVGASRVRDLFKQAKESSPCIIFLDEIDAVGRRRGSGFSSGGHDEREQTLNAILVEMDGFDSSDQVIVIAATNRADVLDPALTRPGRFDRQIQVPLPDIRGRMEILKVHSKKVKMSPDVDLEKLARGTPMFSGAELSAIINEAAIAATLQNKDFVEQVDLEEARDKVKWGRARKSHKIEEDEKRVIAYHEAGHAIVMYFDEHSEPLHKVTIIPRGQSLGTTFMLPERDKNIYSKKQLLSMMRVSYGGRIAEEMFTGDQYNGTAGDIRQASNVARAMVTEYGMTEKLGFQLLGVDDARNPWEQADKLYSDDTAKMIDQEIKRLIDTTYDEAKRMIEAHHDQLEALAQALLKHETLTSEEVRKIMEGEPLNKATVSDLLEAEKNKANESSKGKPGKTIGPDEPHLGGDTRMPSPA